MKKLPLSLVTAILVAGVYLGACSSSDDPIEKMNAVYDGIITMLRTPTEDAKEKSAEIAEYLRQKRAEMQSIGTHLAVEFAAAKSTEEKEAFIRRFDGFLERVRTLQILLKEKNTEL